MALDLVKEVTIFQSTPSAWRETALAQSEHVRFIISIHSLRMEGDQRPRLSTAWQKHFNPLPPHGGRLQDDLCGNQCTGYFNPLPPHGGRLLSSWHCIDRTNISIHSLRMEGDSSAPQWALISVFISIHSLRMEGDVSELRLDCKYVRISIHSLRMEGDATVSSHRP